MPRMKLKIPTISLINGLTMMDKMRIEIVKMKRTIKLQTKPMTSRTSSCITGGGRGKDWRQVLGAVP